MSVFQLQCLCHISLFRMCVATNEGDGKGGGVFVFEDSMIDVKA